MLLVTAAVRWLLMQPTNVMPNKSKTISQYIAAAPKESQTKLRQMRACIRQAAPKAKEEIKWSMPAFTQGRILVMFGGFKKHIGFYPTPAAMRANGKDLSNFKTGKGSVQFPIDQPLPIQLIKKMVKFRIKEVSDKNKKWK
jgi:uncharacterized protein YdhG (YjbR/CyaY superfamily)